MIMNGAAEFFLYSGAEIIIALESGNGQIFNDRELYLSL
jgi:hypothetical protein